MGNVVKLMRVKESLFTHTGLEAERLQLKPYNVLHGWKLLAFFSKQVTGTVLFGVLPKPVPATSIVSFLQAIADLIPQSERQWMADRIKLTADFSTQ
jgi:hypothetical protein